ncbi:MAG: phosphoglycerate dehydrogenase [Pseudomonadota bacterium]|nr:phosphoglycerate dehydrogenase [Pseudomonadota bacterium]MDE3037905.1 phosphoglycerate dehydrogenase [Pseudomonadota bacterium]
MSRVLIADKLSPQAIDVFKRKGVEADVKTGLPPEELLKIIGEYEGIAVRSATKVTAEVIRAGGKLKVIGRAGIGVDNVDVPAATAQGIVVMNTPFGNSVTTAEHAISLMMALARQIPQANASTHAGKWEKSGFMGMELAGKTLGLIGCGNIGSIVADRAQGLKMRVIAYDPYLSKERADAIQVEKVELDSLFERADIVSLHTPLTETTRHIINKNTLAMCKKGVRIVNCARGGLIDEAALKDAIESGQIAGAALDVFEEEPAKKNPLFGMKDVICTPHLGASTAEAQENVAVQVAEQMADYLVSGAVTNALNIPSMSVEDAAKLKPYLLLADWLGSFAGQMTETGLKAVKIDYEGKAASLNTKPLTAVALKGLLAPLVEGANMVNAPVIARERGIGVSATSHERSGDYQALIRITVETDRRARTVAGTLFEGRPRIVEVGGVKLEAGLGAHMLYVNNDDKPGFIGALGTVLGKAGINIANFHLGRNDSHEAVALVEIDQPVSAELLAEIAKVPSVRQVKALVF